MNIKATIVFICKQELVQPTTVYIGEIITINSTGNSASTAGSSFDHGPNKANADCVRECKRVCSNLKMYFSLFA